MTATSVVAFFLATGSIDAAHAEEPVRVVWTAPENCGGTAAEIEAQILSKLSEEEQENLNLEIEARVTQESNQFRLEFSGTRNGRQATRTVVFDSCDDASRATSLLAVLMVAPTAAFSEADAPLLASLQTKDIPEPPPLPKDTEDEVEEPQAPEEKSAPEKKPALEKLRLLGKYNKKNFANCCGPSGTFPERPRTRASFAPRSGHWIGA